MGRATGAALGEAVKGQVGDAGTGMESQRQKREKRQPVLDQKLLQFFILVQMLLVKEFVSAPDGACMLFCKIIK